MPALVVVACCSPCCLPALCMPQPVLQMLGRTINASQKPTRTPWTFLPGPRPPSIWSCSAHSVTSTWLALLCSYSCEYVLTPTDRMANVADSIRDVRRYSDTHAEEGDLRNNPAAEAMMHMKLFRAQRNFYIAGFALFLFLWVPLGGASATRHVLCPGVLSLLAVAWHGWSVARCL